MCRKIRWVYSREIIEELFGPDEVKRIKARHVGGLSGQKGTRFEDLFAVSRLAKELSLCYSRSTFDNVRGAIVRAQMFAIIDDLSVQVKKPRMIEHYQLKNVAQLRWASGSPSIEEDFIRQKQLCNRAKVKSRLSLVVPSRALRNKLQKTARLKVARCATVIFFPYEHVSLLVQSNQEFRNALIRLSPFTLATAENDKLLSLATFICGHWFTADNEISIEGLAGAMESDAGAFSRPMRGNRPMPSDVSRFLSEVPRFKWTLSKGFLFWKYGNTDSGRYPHHCWTSEFARLLRRIRQIQPKTFEAIEGDLR
jgi:hypothetical protein